MKHSKWQYSRGVIFPAVIILGCTFGFLLAPNHPEQVNMSVRFLAPCVQYPLGTDQMGRCVLSRLLYGGRTTLGIVLVGAALVTLLGTVVGLVMGSNKNGRNILVESVLNAVTAIPPMAYLIIFIAAWGNGIATMMIAVTVSLFLRVIKLVRTRTAIELQKAYVLCAVAVGAGKGRILFRHILPNLLWDVLHFMCLSCADMILAIVGFSFIGLGLGDNTIDWGTMVAETHHYLIAYPGLTMYPVVFIVLCTLAFHLLGRWIEKGMMTSA